jgi:hypothetical protein
MSIFRFRCTAAVSRYDREAQFQREDEAHFDVSRAGSPRRVRRALARRAAAYLQRDVYRRRRVWIPLRQIRVSFEREELAAAAEKIIKVYTRSMRYRGKQWSATALPTRVIPYSKKRRCRVAKRKRSRN